MNRIKKINNGGFTQISNQLIDDFELDSEARFLYIYMYSRPDDWTFYNKQMCKAMKIKSEETLRKYVKQLVEFGWLEVTQLREKGVFKENQYTIYQQSSNKKYNTVNDLPYPKKTDTGKNRHGKNIVHNNTNSLNNTNTNNNTNVNNDLKNNDRLPDTSKTIKTETLNTYNLPPEKLELFVEWINYRKEIKKPIKAKRTFDSLLKKFESTDVTIISKVVNKSIDNQYQGLFWDNVQIDQKEKVNNATPVKKASSLFDVLNRKTQ